MTTPPPGQYPPGQPYGMPPGPGGQGYPQPAYGQPVFQPVVLPPQMQPVQQQPQPRQEPPTGGAAQTARRVLITAAIVGLVTVLVGVVIMVNHPDEYAPSSRTSLKMVVPQNGLAPSVGPGGVGQPLTQAVAGAPAPLPKLPAAPALQPSTPKRLIIRKIGVNAPISSVGLDRAGAIQTPPINNHNLVGWYRGGPTAGEAGPAVMLGHKDTVSRSAVFSRLHELAYGDTIEVTRMDGTVAVFTVGGVEQADKQTFPTSRVYGQAADAELRLITCGGSYNRTTGHYTDNVIVYALMTGTRLAKSKS
ncbi:class F sortase [Microbispora triticiradicis]|uniref:class F sortase n=1 Tax=Microbispora triticiradicis TaxID=2200763 RepID=UPI001AD6E813|nr:class F sortase [Microbispora triticiradicis]MBO4272005.1 class F sortase [Microbispora triticiradicis]